MKKSSGFKLKKIVSAFIGTILSIACMLASVVPAFAATSYTYSANVNENQTGKTTKKSWTQVDDNTWTMDFDGDGTTDVTLVSSVDSDGNDVWTYTFNVEDDTQLYYVYENMFNNSAATTLRDGYTSKGSDSTTDKTVYGIEQDPGKVDTSTHTYTITNSKSHTTNTPEQTGSLRITKSVTGTMSDPDQKFTFTIKLEGSTTALQKKISGANVYGSVPFMDGTATVSLGNGGSVDMTDIPAGLTYTITEDVPDGYGTPASTNATGTIANDTAPDTWTAAETSAWTNNSTYTPPVERSTVSFAVTKTATGSAKPSGNVYYSYHVLFDNLKINTNYTYSLSNGTGDGTFTSSSTGAADVSFLLKDGGKATFSGIQTEATYQVLEKAGEYDASGSETDADYTPSYTVTDASNANKIASSTGSGKTGEDLSTAKETADAGENITIAFANDYPATQNLTIRKYISEKINGTLVTTDKDSAAYKALTGKDKTEFDKYFDQEFDMTVHFFNLPAGTSFNSPYGKITPDEDGEGAKTFKIKADGTPVVFEDIPAGVQYQVTEDAGSFSPSYVITTTDMKGKTITGTVNSATGESDETAAETVEDNQSDIVTFTNEYKGINFGIFKLNGTTALSGAKYELFSYKDNTKTSLGTKTTQTNGFAGWTAVPAGTYILKETEAPKGYTVSEDILFVLQDDGTIKYAKSQDAESDAKKLTTARINAMETWSKYQDYTDASSGAVYQTYRIDDQKLPEFPSTGGAGLYIFLIAFTALVFFGLYMLRKEGKKQ